MRKQIVAFSLALLAASSPVAAQETSFLDDIRFFFLAFFDSTVNQEVAPMIIVNGVEVHPGDSTEIAPMIIVDGLAGQEGADDDSEYAPMIVPNG